MRGSIIRLVACLCLVMILVVSIGTAAAQDSIRVIVNDVVADPIPDEPAYQVTVYVTVARTDGQPISGLTTDAFTVSQDGSAVELDSAVVSQRPASFVLVIDTSGSSEMDAVKTAATSFVDQLAAEDQVAVVSFNDAVVTGQQDLTSDFMPVKNVISLLQAAPDAGTCLYDAAYSAVELASKAPQGNRVVVLLTNGIDERADQSGPCSRHTLDDVTALAQDSATRTPIYTIGVGTRVNADELGGMAESTGGVSLLSPGTEGITSLFDTVGAQVKNQYALMYRSGTTSGEHSLTVTVTSQGVTTTAARKFHVPQPLPRLSLSGLENDAILTGSQVVRAMVSDEAEVTGVTFMLDGKPLAQMSKAPFEVVLDAGALSEGRHELVAAANLADGTQLKRSLTFEVPAAQSGTTTKPENRSATVTSGLPGWAVPAGIAAVVILGGVVGYSLLQRRPRTRIIGGIVMASGRRGGTSDLAMDIVSGEKFASLAVVESLTLRKGQAFDLSGDVVTIGRGVDNRIIVPDASIAHNHAEIRRQAGKFRVVDLGTGYGTSVNDARVGDAGLPIGDGDTLRLGTSTTMIFNVIMSQTEGDQDSSFDRGAGILSGSDATIPAGALEVNEGGAAPTDMPGVGDRDDTLPAQIIIPKETQREPEQHSDDQKEGSERLYTMSNDTVRSDLDDDDATLRPSG